MSFPPSVLLSFWMLVLLLSPVSADCLPAFVSNFVPSSAPDRAYCRHGAVVPCEEAFFLVHSADIHQVCLFSFPVSPSAMLPMRDEVKSQSSRSKEEEKIILNSGIDSSQGFSMCVCVYEYVYVCVCVCWGQK